MHFPGTHDLPGLKNRNTQAGSYTFTLQVKDSAGNTATRQLTIVVN